MDGQVNWEYIGVASLLGLALTCVVTAFVRLHVIPWKIYESACGDKDKAVDLAARLQVELDKQTDIAQKALEQAEFFRTLLERRQHGSKRPRRNR